MHGLVRKGLLLSVATGALVLGGAAAAMADTATANGSTNGNEGAIAGNVAQLSGNNPVNICGDTAGFVTANTGAKANDCTTSGNSATIAGSSAHSPGAIAGNVVGAAVDAPIQVCGVSAQALSAGSSAMGNTCVDTGTSAAAHGSTNNSGGIGSGNVLQLAENAPVSVCGDDIGILAFSSSATANSCVNGPTTPPFPTMPPPPPEDCPPPTVITPPTSPHMPPPPEDCTPPTVVPPPADCMPPPPVEHCPPPPVEHCPPPTVITPHAATPLDSLSGLL